jgi:hypothetical protein
MVPPLCFIFAFWTSSWSKTVSDVSRHAVPEWHASFSDTYLRRSLCRRGTATVIAEAFIRQARSRLYSGADERKPIVQICIGPGQIVDNYDSPFME